MVCNECPSKVRVPLSKDEFRRPGDLDFSLSLGYFGAVRWDLGHILGTTLAGFAQIC